MVNAVTNLIQIANSLIFNRILTINGQVSQIDHMSDQSWILLRLFGVKNHQILEIFIWQMLCYLTRNALFFYVFRISVDDCWTKYPRFKLFHQNLRTKDGSTPHRKLKRDWGAELASNLAFMTSFSPFQPPPDLTNICSSFINGFCKSTQTSQRWKMFSNQVLSKMADGWNIPTHVQHVKNI